MEKVFKLSKNGTNVKTEIMAGLTTFFTMAYILMVNSTMFSDPFGNGKNVLGVSYGAIYIATAISAIVGTLLIGFLSNLPLAQASGMGLNAFFVYTVCIGLGMTYSNALVLVLIDGVTFVVLTVTGLRKVIFDAIPEPVRISIPAGIGLFIAFLGLQDSKIVIPDTSTGVTLGSFNMLGSAKWSSVMPMIVTIVTVIAIAVMSKKNIKGSVLWGIFGGSALYYLLGCSVPGFYKDFTSGMSFSPIAAFRDFGKFSFGKVFTQGFDFSAFAAKNGTANLVLAIITTSLAFCMVDMFDTMGTLYGACARGNMLTKDGKIPNMNRAMLADAVATCTGSVCGTSTVTTYVESSAGVAEGGRTGLTSCVVAAMFLVSMFLSPVAQLIPGCATAAALIYVGVLMMACVKEIDWHSIDIAVPAFLTIAMMPFTYNISYGIAFGLFSYVVINLFTGKAKKIQAGTWVIAILFMAMLFLTH
jgi:AGZA family xanthine/uracil permease-like MFS transporter